MTKESITQPKEVESLEKLLLHADKALNDRTNIIIAANSFLLLPFASLITQVTGYLLAIPIIICGIGIDLNTFLILSSKIQTNKTKESLRNLTESGKISPSFKDYFKTAGTKDNSMLFDIFNKYAPIFMIIAWSLCLIFFILQNIGIITI